MKIYKFNDLFILTLNEQSVQMINLHWIYMDHSLEQQTKSYEYNVHFGGKKQCCLELSSQSNGLF